MDRESVFFCISHTLTSEHLANCSGSSTWSTSKRRRERETEREYKAERNGERIQGRLESGESIGWETGNNRHTQQSIIDSHAIIYKGACVGVLACIVARSLSAFVGVSYRI